MGGGRLLLEAEKDWSPPTPPHAIHRWRAVILFPAYERIPLLFLKTLTRTHTSNKNSSTPTTAARAAAEATAIEKCFDELQDG